MPRVKSLFVAVMALFKVAVSSTAFSSELEPAVTAIQYVTSATFVSALASASSNKACEVATVTGSMTTPNGTVTTPGHYGGSTAMTTATMNATKTVTTSSTRTVTRTSAKMNHSITTMTDGTATSIMSAPALTFSSSHYHGNVSTTANTSASTTTIVTGTSSSAMLSAIYAAPNNSVPLFTAAADATNVGAAVLAGGFLMALGF